MFLYELAIELDQRSTDLVDAAAELGMGELQPPSELDARQVAALRARFGHVVPPPLPPPSASAASNGGGGRFKRRRNEPTPPPPPLAPPAAPLGPAAAGGLVGPATWAPPADAPAPEPVSAAAAGPVAPAHWGPPPGASGGAPPVVPPPVSAPLAPAAPLAPPDPPAAAPSSAPAPPPSSTAAVAGAPLAFSPMPTVPAAEPTNWLDRAEPVPPGPGGYPTPPSSGRGMGTGQIVLIGAVVIAVIGLFGYMFANGGTDQERLDEIAQADPTEVEVAVTGPNGKPLTEAEKAGLAKMKAVEEAKAEQACAALDDYGDADAWGYSMPMNIDTIEGMRTYMASGLQQGSAALDRVAAALPEQAGNARALKAFHEANYQTFLASDTADELRANGEALADQATRDGWYAAADALDDYARTTCGIDIGRPT